MIKSAKCSVQKCKASQVSTIYSTSIHQTNIAVLDRLNPTREYHNDGFSRPFDILPFVYEELIRPGSTILSKKYILSLPLLRNVLLCIFGFQIFP